MQLLSQTGPYVVKITVLLIDTSYTAPERAPLEKSKTAVRYATTLQCWVSFSFARSKLKKSRAQFLVLNIQNGPPLLSTPDSDVLA